MRQEVQQEKRYRYSNVCHQSRTTSPSHHQLHQPRCTHSAFLLVVIGNMLFLLSKFKHQIPAHLTFLRVLCLQLSYFSLLNFSPYSQKNFSEWLSLIAIFISSLPFLFSQAPNSTTQLKWQLSRPTTASIFAKFNDPSQFLSLFMSQQYLTWLITPPF